MQDNLKPYMEWEVLVSARESSYEILLVEEHRSLGGSIISRLDNGAFVGLIYEILVFS